MTELLVVIAIIALLAAILYPVLSRAKVAAGKSRDIANLRQLALGTSMYTDDNDGAFIVFSWDRKEGYDLGPFWSDRLMPYVKGRGIFSDPLNRQEMRSVPYWKPGAIDKADDDAARVYRVTYTYNHLVAHSDDGFLTGKSANVASVDLPATTVLLGPSAGYFSFSQCRVLEGKAALVWDVSADGSDCGYDIWGGVHNAAYFGGANFAYVDGHVGYGKLSMGGDPVFGDDDGAFVAVFPRAVNRAVITNDGFCPDTERGSTTYGF